MQVLQFAQIVARLKQPAVLSLLLGIPKVGAPEPARAENQSHCSIHDTAAQTPLKQLPSLVCLDRPLSLWACIAPAAAGTTVTDGIEALPHGILVYVDISEHVRSL